MNVEQALRLVTSQAATRQPVTIIPSIPPICPVGVWAKWEGKTAACIRARIASGAIPASCVLRPSKKVLLIDVGRYIEFLRGQQPQEVKA